MSDATPRYELLAQVGEGAFGVVYRARLVGPRGFQQEVAIKVLREGVPASVVARFRDEARILGLLRDRAIVAVQPPTRIEGRWALVMEWVDGANLAALRARGPLPDRVAAEVVGEVARALDVAFHQPGPEGPLHLLHRDLKPANVQVTPTGQVKILDFGTARAAIPREVETTVHITGTPAYLAPERLRGQEGPEGDVYSLGVMLAELVRDPAAPLAELAGAMAHPDPARRPTAHEVDQRCTSLLAELAGPSLRTWAEGEVSAAPIATVPTVAATVPGGARARWPLGVLGVLAVALALWALLPAGPPTLEEALRQPFLDFVMEANATVSERSDLRRPERWDEVLYRDVGQALVRLDSPATWQRLDQVWATWAAVVQRAREAGLPEVVAGQAWVESRYTPELQSSHCAKGLWQFMPETAVAQGLRVGDCRMQGSDSLWSPSAGSPSRPLIYVRDGQCRIPARLGCAIDERTDVALSTAAAMRLFTAPWTDPTLRATGAAVQLTIASHMAGYAPNPHNVLGAYSAWAESQDVSLHPQIFGALQACADDPACTPGLEPWVLDGVVSAIAVHFLAVCYYARNYPQVDAFRPWEKYRDGYCRSLEVPDRADLALVPISAP